MSQISYPAAHGEVVTRKSKRPTDRAPHMGQYARVGVRYGKPGVWMVIEGQAFFLPVSMDDDMTKAERAKHLLWNRDMLCIALDRLVEQEILRRGSTS